MRVLITGGAGFIGSFLAESCLEAGHEVYIIDDLSTGSLSNIEHLQTHPEFSTKIHVTVDTILNNNKMLELIGICDVVFHMAAAVGVQYIIDNPLSSIITNVRGTETVLELCNKFRKKVIIASTSEVYGKHDHAPLVETDDCVYGPSEKCRWSYAAGKLMDEFTAIAYNRTNGLETIVVRLFNTVGPRQTGRYGMVIPRFVQQALQGKPITIYGDGKQTRTFTHVKEVVACLMKLMISPEAVGQVVNIGGVEEVSILELGKRIKSLTNSTSEIQFIPYDKAYPKDFEDMQRRVPSTEKLRRITGLAPETKLNMILEDVILYFSHSRASAEKQKQAPIQKRRPEITESRPQANL